MKNKIFKIILLVLILAVVGLLINNAVAADWDFHQFDNGNAGRAGLTATNIMGAIINLTTIVASGIAIIMLIAIGIKYVNSGVTGKAEVKKDLTGYVTGVVILFGVTGLLKLIQMFIEANIDNA